MEKAVLLSNILSVLQKFSSEEFQERVWVKGAGPEFSSYEEACNQFFDDYLANKLIDEEWLSVGLTKLQHDALAKFRDALEDFNAMTPEISDPVDILERPEWPHIRALAKEAVKAFKGLN